MNKPNFKLYKSTLILTGDLEVSKSILSGIKRMKRDMDMVLEQDNIHTVIRLEKAVMGEEEYRISFRESGGRDNRYDRDMIITAGGDLGFIYAFLYISEIYLDMTPFWFWNDQQIKRKESVSIPMETVCSPSYQVKYRGWFINDEVLLNTWKIDGDNALVWEMVFEALLRLGGNTVIPGTDKNSRIHRKQASDMGLWISHHHAEPLGAEMFSRVYPELKPSYDRYPEKFSELWRQGVNEQKEMKVIWNLGFRGQGDCPFWSNDEQYQTSESRGKLIGQVMEKQAAIVREQVKNPVFCTNLYGEIMELYMQGHIKLPDNTIRIRADNGYGKMVSRRQDLYNPRVPALPGEKEQAEGEPQGIYYHVSFYDLQAANHITMLPNSVEFVGKELKGAFSCGVNDFLIVNCSNVKPHVYFLEAVAALWKRGDLDVPDYKMEYMRKYYGDAAERKEDILKHMAGCFDRYAQSAIAYGAWEDEHAGEQFYTYMTRGFYNNWMQGLTKDCVKNLIWATGKIPFAEQINWYLEKCESGLERFQALEQECREVRALLKSPLLWQDSIELQVRLHVLCQKGAVDFCRAYREFEGKEYQRAFYLIGKSAGYYRKADALLRSREHDEWEGFYANECLSDIKLTAYLLGHLMGYIRNIGDGPYFITWQRELFYTESDRKVMLITNFENHATDEEVFRYMEKIMKE